MKQTAAAARSFQAQRVAVFAACCVCLALLPLACTTVDGTQLHATVSAVCVAEEGALDADATLEEAAGSYRLTLVAPAADGGQVSVSGSLHLQPNEPSLREFAEGVSTPLYGWVDIELQAVGAVEVGDAGSRDPLHPGVLVLEQRPDPALAPRITLRLGSLANLRTERGAFDGGYLALHVEQLARDSFRGGWVSGVHAARVVGHFCADRVVQRT